MNNHKLKRFKRNEKNLLQNHNSLSCFYNRRAHFSDGWVDFLLTPLSSQYWLVKQSNAVWKHSQESERFINRLASNKHPHIRKLIHTTRSHSGLIPPNPVFLLKRFIDMQKRIMTEIFTISWEFTQNSLHSSLNKHTEWLPVLSVIGAKYIKLQITAFSL